MEMARRIRVAKITLQTMALSKTSVKIVSLGKRSNSNVLNIMVVTLS